MSLTFDSGPNPNLTPGLLDLLHQEGVKATFFVLGRRVEAHPEMVRRIQAEGHVVGNHTWSHADLTTLSDEGIRDEVGSTEQALVAAGVRSSGLIRPPNGRIDARVANVLASMGLTPVNWTVWSLDWTDITPDEIVNNVLKGLRPGWTNNVMMHDGPTPSASTLQTVPRIIAAARAAGYCFATLGRDGKPVYAVPVVRATATSGYERGRRPVRVWITLDRVTARTVPVTVTTIGGTARTRKDYRRVNRVVWFPAGVTRVHVDVPVVKDRKRERREWFTIHLRGDQRSQVRTTQLRAWIVNAVR